MDTPTALIVIAVIGLLVALGVRAMVSLATVHDYERGLRYSRGRFRGLVAPGSYVVFRPLTEIRVLDARPTSMTVEGQEVVLADGAAVKVSLVARYVLGDAVAAVTGDRDAWRTLYLSLQLRLREALVERTLDQVLADRVAIGPAIRDRAATSVATIGLELLEVDVRDVMLGAELRRAFAGVVAARKEGDAALERARGEAAALRSLANAGRMVEDNPGLLQLRLVQQLGAGSGNTLMVSLPEVPGGPTAARTPRRPSSSAKRADAPGGDTG